MRIKYKMEVIRNSNKNDNIWILKRNLNYGDKWKIIFIVALEADFFLFPHSPNWIWNLYLDL